jgi:hypothetical protein
VLVLVTEHHLVQHAVSDAAFIDDLECPRANLLEVLARLRRSQQREVAPHRARGLERVIHRRQVFT